MCLQNKKIRVLFRRYTKHVPVKKHLSIIWSLAISLPDLQCSWQFYVVFGTLKKTSRINPKRLIVWETAPCHFLKLESQNERHFWGWLKREIFIFLPLPNREFLPSGGEVVEVTEPRQMWQKISYLFPSWSLNNVP